MCEKTGICPFYKKEIENLPDNSDELVTKYCEGNSLNCARAMVYDALGDDSVPADLLPDEKPQAYAIISG